jgi:hypothetical protein
MAFSDNVEPQLPEKPSELDHQVTDKWKDFPWQQFPGYVRSQRPGVTTSWIWSHGFDIELAADSSKRKWVCIYCLQRKLSKLIHFSSLGTQNVESHLFQVY